MINFSDILNLPVIWGGLIATAVFLYVLLDGFDLGIGILFPFAPSDKCRDRMMHSIAPFWDSNETWLVLGGGGLFASFPLAYSIIMPALYIPIIMMLLGLIFRGVAFEFRAKASAKRKVFWEHIFHFGSLIAAFMQGMILGSILQGIEVEGRVFAGGPFDWMTGFTFMTGVALVFGYMLLASTWLVMKTTDVTQAWGRKTARYLILFIVIFMLLLSAAMPDMDQQIQDLWFSRHSLLYLLPFPVLSLFTIFILYKDLQNPKREIRPYILSNVLFLLNYIALVISIWPYIVPFQVTLWEAAATATSQSILLIGIGIFLPIILIYTGHCYYVFRGKTQDEHIEDDAY